MINDVKAKKLGIEVGELGKEVGELRHGLGDMGKRIKQLETHIVQIANAIGHNIIPDNFQVIQSSIQRNNVMSFN